MKDSLRDSGEKSRSGRKPEVLRMADGAFHAGNPDLTEDVAPQSAEFDVFVRDPVRAQATQDAIMGRVHAMDIPRRGRASVLRFPRGVQGTGRLATILAAAALVAIASSLLTVWAVNRSETVNVRFVLDAPEARSVMLAADFTDWSPAGHDLEKNAETGEWEIIVPLRKGRAYSYNFVIDGERWVADPSAAMILDDGLGGSVSSISL